MFDSIFLLCGCWDWCFRSALTVPERAGCWLADLGVNGCWCFWGWKDPGATGSDSEPEPEVPSEFIWSSPSKKLVHRQVGGLTQGPKCVSCPAFGNSAPRLGCKSGDPCAIPRAALLIDAGTPSCGALPGLRPTPGYQAATSVDQRRYRREHLFALLFQTTLPLSAQHSPLGRQGCGERPCTGPH